MAKKKTTPEKPKTKTPSLAQLRAEIDKLDQEILRMVNQRAGVALKVGEVKAAEGLKTFSPDREQEVLDRVIQQNPGPLNANSIQTIFRELMSGCRQIQQTIRVAFLGPEYSFSHLAAIERFGQSVEYIPISSIAGVFETVHRGQANLGIVPIENSTDGRIADTLDMFVKLPLKIVGEVSLRIHHHLMAMCSQGEVLRVYSKPQALSQCRKWLATHVPNAQLQEVASTTTAVKLAKQEPYAAAVASREAAVAYGLNILVSDIEDRENNITRFAVIGHELSPRTGKDKTSILLQISDAPGALYDALSAFKKNKVNMTWIESFPVSHDGKGQAYVFFVDVAGHVTDLKVKRAIASLERRTKNIVVLGSFHLNVGRE